MNRQRLTLVASALVFCFGTQSVFAEDGQNLELNPKHQLGDVTINGEKQEINDLSQYSIGTKDDTVIIHTDRQYQTTDKDGKVSTKGSHAVWVGKDDKASVGDKVSIGGKAIQVTSELGRGVYVNAGGTLELGTKDTEVISVKGKEIGIGVIEKDSQLTVTSKRLNVSAEGFGIHVQNNSQKGASPENAATLNVNADTIVVNSDSLGLSAFSHGRLNVTGNITVTAKNAIDVRGNSIVNINTDGKHTTVLNGDIVFETPATPENYQNSGEIINSYVNVVLNGEGSSWTGRAYQEYSGATSVELEAIPFTGNVTGFKLDIANGAQWNMNGDSFINNVTVADGGVINVGKDVETFNAADVALDEGVLNLQGGNQQAVNVSKLSGTGTVKVAANSTDGETFETAKLKIAATDNVDLNVQLDGVTADDVKDTEAAFVALNDAIVAGSEDNPVTLKKTNRIVEGNVRGEMVETFDENGQSQGVQTYQNTKLSAFSSVSALSALTWRHEINSLNKRMGELRDAPNGIGSWVRMYGSEMEYGAQSVENKNTTVQVGSDVSAGDWKFGLAAHYTDGDSTYDNGQADSKNYGIALYGTWFVPCGAYVDLIAKYSRIDTDFALNGMNGSYDNNAFSASVEAGYRFNFAEDRVFVEPQVELSYGYVNSADFKTGNGVRIQQDSFESTIGRIGVRTGFTFPNKKGSVYARVSGVYDFQGEMNGMASLVDDASVREALKEDLGGSWVEYGVGANFNWTENTYTYVDLERTSGGEVRENYRWNVGLRHVF